MNRKIFIFAALMLAISILLVACGGDTPESEEIQGAPTMIDQVIVEARNGHYYAVASVTYPDACSRISDINQSIAGDTFSISLATDNFPGVACAQMLSLADVDILLEVGGQEFGDYTVDVNGVTTSFTLGE